MLSSRMTQDVLASVADPFVAAPLSTFYRLRSAAVDLFVRYEQASDPVLFCRAGWPLAPERLDKLADARIDQLLVRSGELYRFSTDLLESLDELLHQENVSQPEKFAVLQVAVAAEMEKTLRAVKPDKYCTLVEKISRDLVDLLTSHDVLPRDLFRLARHDVNTFAHVTNVASYSVILAQRLGYESSAELEQIALGAMLHDIGKRTIPASLLVKAGTLTAEERMLMETHPLTGYRELRDRPDLAVGQLMMIYQHHERVDGSGYPVRITGDEIHPWARLLAVVDVFDALTAKRPYRRPASIASALEYLDQQAGTHFDAEMTSCWISAMTQK